MSIINPPITTFWTRDRAWLSFAMWLLAWAISLSLSFSTPKILFQTEHPTFTPNGRDRLREVKMISHHFLLAQITGSPAGACKHGPQRGENAKRIWFFFHDQHLTENKDGNYVRKEDEYDLHYISKATETFWFSLNYVF